MKITQHTVDAIVARAQNSAMGLGEPEKGARSYDLSQYAEPQTFENVAMLLVGAHFEKYDLVALFAAAMEVVASEVAPKPRAKTLKPKASERGFAFADWFRSTLADGVKLSAKWREDWAVCFDHMQLIDGRTPEQIAAVCKWARGHDFWRSHFLTPLKLRQRKDGAMYFDRFAESMQGPCRVVEVPAELREYVTTFVEETGLEITISKERLRDLAEIVRRGIAPAEVRSVLRAMVGMIRAGKGGLERTSLQWHNAMSPDKLEGRVAEARRAARAKAKKLVPAKPAEPSPAASSAPMPEAGPRVSLVEMVQTQMRAES